MVPDDKLIYTIGDAARLVDVKPYVLRYWETEFPQLRPEKSITGQRCYRKKDLRIAQTIKRLLHDEKFTIAGALQKLDELGEDGLDQITLFGPAGRLSGPADEALDAPGVPAGRLRGDEVEVDPMAQALMHEPQVPPASTPTRRVEDRNPRPSASDPNPSQTFKALLADCLRILQKYE